MEIAVMIFQFVMFQVSGRSCLFVCFLSNIQVEKRYLQKGSVMVWDPVPSLSFYTAIFRGEEVMQGSASHTADTERWRFLSFSWLNPKP